MELGLSLGNNSLGICSMGLGLKSSPPSKLGEGQDHDQDDDNHDQLEKRREKIGSSSSDPCSLLQLHLIPTLSPRRNPPTPTSLRFPWLPDTLSSEPGSSDGPGSRVVDMNRRGGGGEEVEEQSSPNSGTSEFSLYTSNSGGGGRARRREDNNYGQQEEEEEEEEAVMEIGVGGGERMATTTTTNSRGSDDEENGNPLSTRKKLRLSKEQSAFLEDNFKEHHTLNPKQKLELAKQLNLRPRQVEVWFQNRRARTKLKQTEVDCEYLKRCCETLTEENRRLQKELQELRALKTSQPFFMHLPATTLTMCPSCERVAPTSSSSASATATGPATTRTTALDSNITLSLGKPKPMLPFSLAQAQAHQAPS